MVQDLKSPNWQIKLHWNFDRLTFLYIKKKKKQSISHFHLCQVLGPVIPILVNNHRRGRRTQSDKPDKRERERGGDFPINLMMKGCNLF